MIFGYGLIELGHHNFNTIISQSKLSAVLFHFPLCYDPVDMIDEFQGAAQLLNNNPDITLASIDVSRGANHLRSYHFNISTYPTIKIFLDGAKEVHCYDGPYDAWGLANCLNRLYAFPIYSLPDATQLDQHYKDKILIVGVFPQLSGQEYQNFMSAAQILKWDYDICLTSAVKDLPYGDSSLSLPIVRMLVPFHDRYIDIKTFDVNALVKSVRDNSIPDVFLLNDHPQGILDRFFHDTEKDKVALFIDREDFNLEYGEVANKYKRQGIFFMLGDLKDRRLRKYPEYRIYAETNEPVVVITNPKKVKYVKQGLKVGEIETLVENYKKCELSQFEKSESIPLENYGPVEVVVADTFKEMVMDSRFCVLLEFYHPGFANCTEVASILHDVAVYFKEYYPNDVIIIANLDVSVNDIPCEKIDDLKISGGSPTLYLFPAKNKHNPKKYVGDITSKEDIINFIVKNEFPSKRQRTGGISNADSLQDMECSYGQ
ncbi:hypothetical protein ACFE04_029624 [Oxalis oulophora]